MAKTSKDTYINAELDWAEQQLHTWKQYVDDNPINKLKDRVQMKASAKGSPYPIVIASIEAQGKFIQETMKNYLALLEVVDNLRNKEQAKIVPRGGAKISSQAEKFLEKRG